MDPNISISEVSNNTPSIPVKKNALQPQNPFDLINLAVSKKSGIEVLERLMVLQKEWLAMQAHKEFLEALTKFQSIVPEIPKSKKVDFESKRTGGKVKYAYAPLEVIKKTIQPSLFECGLSYRWAFEDNAAEKRTICKCYISHVGGHTEIFPMDGPLDDASLMNNLQQLGSTRTYMQRYTLVGGLGLTSADEDNDGVKPDTVKVELLNEIIQLNKSGKLDAEKNNLVDKYFKKGIPKRDVAYMINDALVPVEESNKLLETTIIQINEFSDAKELQDKYAAIYNNVKKKLTTTQVAQLEIAFNEKFEVLRGGK